MKFSANPNASKQRCVNPLSQNECPLFMFPCLFQRIPQLLQVRINKQYIHKHSVNYKPSY